MSLGLYANTHRLYIYYSCVGSRCHCRFLVVCSREMRMIFTFHCNPYFCSRWWGRWYYCCYCRCGCSSSSSSFSSFASSSFLRLLLNLLSSPSSPPAPSLKKHDGVLFAPENYLCACVWKRGCGGGGGIRERAKEKLFVWFGLLLGFCCCCCCCCCCCFLRPRAKGRGVAACERGIGDKTLYTAED